MAGLAALATIAQGAGTLVSVVGAVNKGAQQASSSRYQASVEEQQANASLAAGQHRAAEIHKEGRFIESRQRAVAAANGGGGDVSVRREMGLTRMETELSADTEIAGGQTTANRYRDAAAVSRVNARRHMTNGVLGGIGQGINGAVSMYDRFATRQQYG